MLSFGPAAFIIVLFFLMIVVMLLPLVMLLLPLIIVGFFVLLGLASTALWIWALIDCATHEPNEGNDKVVWILVIVFTHFIGALIYICARRPQRIARYGR